MSKQEDFDMKDQTISDLNSMLVARKDLERNRASLIRTQKIAGIGGFEFLPEDDIILLSDEAIDILGLSEDIKSYLLPDFCKKISSGINADICSILQNFSSADTARVTEFIIKDDNREYRYIEVYFDSESPTVEGGVSGVFHDITRRKRAEIHNNAHAEAFDTVFYNTKIGILVLNLKGEVIDYNNSALELFGYSDSEMKKMHSLNLLVEKDKLDASKIFARFINSAGRVNFMEYRLKRKNNKVFDVLVNFEMIITPEGERIYIFINDISDMKEMERKNVDQERMLVQQSKMATLGEMVALIAHQWQQPINSIAMIVQMLEELIEIDDKNRKILEKSVESVMSQVTFMSGTMNDFRNFLKPSDVKNNFNIHRMVKDVVSLYRPQLRYYRIECEVHAENERIKRAEVFGYENELKNVILNFLTNSRDAIENTCPKRGQVQIMLSGDEDNVQLCIEDNGGGVPENILKKLFSPYVSTKGDKGTGLGLYMAKLIICERMGGEILINNHKDGLKVCLEDYFTIQVRNDVFCESGYDNEVVN